MESKTNRKKVSLNKLVNKLNTSRSSTISIDDKKNIKNNKKFNNNIQLNNTTDNYDQYEENNNSEFERNFLSKLSENNLLTINSNIERKINFLELNYKNGNTIKTLFILDKDYKNEENKEDKENDNEEDKINLNSEDLDINSDKNIINNLNKNLFNIFSNYLTNHKIIELNLKNPENKIYQINYKAYKNAPFCITKTFNINNVLKTKSNKNAQLIWKLYKFDKMMKLIPQLNKNQKYNHFPKTFQLGRKDLLWKNFKKMQKKYSTKDFYYMPITFLFPQDSQNFINLKKLEKTSWIIKPVASSRGRGIHLLTDLNEIEILLKKSQQKSYECLISKYLDNPHLINNKKYDLRIYVLIVSFTPLKIYFFDEGLVRFASENYTKENKENIFVHLTNYAINKKNKNYEMNNLNDDINNTSKWSLENYKTYFTENNLVKEFENIFIKIKDIVIKTILSATDENLQVLRGVLKYKNSLFELYGFDIMIDDKFNPWLLEVNVSPSLNCDSELDLKIKSDLIKDAINILGINPNYEILNNNTYNINSNNIIMPLLNTNSNDKKTNISKFKIKVCKDFSINKSNLDFTEEEKIIFNEIQEYQEIINNYLSEIFRSQFGKFNLIFPNLNTDKNNLKYYSQFVNNPGDDNILLWKWIVSNK